MTGGRHLYGPRLVQPFPAGMAAPPAVPTPERAALIARITRLKPHARRRLELEARLRDLTCRELEAALGWPR